MKAYWKIPKEWVQEWGLSGLEAILLADIKSWDKPCTLDERAVRCGMSKNGVRKALENIAKKVPQSSTDEVPQSVLSKVHKVAQKSTQSGTEKCHKVAFPPHPPIIEEHIEEHEDITLDKSNVPNADASAGKKTSQKKEKKEEPKVYTIQHRCRTFFETIYEQKKGDKYYYAAKDAAALKQLLNKIKFLMPEEQKKDEAKLEENFQIFINTIFHSKILGAWITDNLSLPIINDKFNEIYSQLKNGKPRQQQQQNGPTDDFLRRVAAEVAANGGLAF